MSTLTGARISDEDTVADKPCPSASSAKLVAGTALFSTCDSLEDTSLIPLLLLLLRCEDDDTSSLAAHVSVAGHWCTDGAHYIIIIAKNDSMIGIAVHTPSITWCRECMQRPCCTSSVAALALIRAPEVAGIRKAYQAPLIPQARRVRELPAVLLGTDLR